MAGSTLNFNTGHIVNQYGWTWTGLAIPGAGARTTLHTDGTPESVANPSAKHLGHTNEGWNFAATPEIERLSVDEQVAPVKVTPVNLNAFIEGNIVQITDLSGVQQYLVQGFGTYATAAGYEQIQLGIIPVTYTAAALIWPLEADPTKFAVFNLYRAINEPGLSGQVRRRAMGNQQVRLTGNAISSRAATDSVGNYWKQI